MQYQQKKKNQYIPTTWQENVKRKKNTYRTNCTYLVQRWKIFDLEKVHSFHHGVNPSFMETPVFTHFIILQICQIVFYHHKQQQLYICRHRIPFKAFLWQIAACLNWTFWILNESFLRRPLPRKQVLRQNQARIKKLFTLHVVVVHSGSAERAFICDLKIVLLCKYWFIYCS